MKFFEDIIRKLKSPSNVLALFAIFLTAFAFWDMKKWTPIILSLISVSVLLLIITITIKIVKFYKSPKPLEFFPNWKGAPPNYSIEKTIGYESNNQIQIDVIGRTCFRWLCGDETNYNNDEKKELLEKEQSILQDKIFEAVKNGKNIHFVLKNPYIPIKQFTKKENEKLKSQAEMVIQSYDKILKRINSGSVLGKLQLSFVDDIVENSMVRISENSKIVRFIFDLSIKFKKPRVSEHSISKPFLVFSNEIEPNEYLDEFDYLIGKSKFKEDVEKKRNEYKLKIDTLSQKYPRSSKQRGDTSENLKAVAAKYYLEETSQEIRVPPTTVQLLVTNQCTTKCLMCGHHDLYSKNDEMDITELNYVLSSINEIGTNSIIISGGEPLARPDIFEILEEGAKKNLKMGILTNGIKIGCHSLNNDEAMKISKTCKWVQVSVDSFDENLYSTIRKGGSLEKAIESIKCLVDAGVEQVEICYTIQKANIKEVGELSKKISKSIHNLIPNSVPIRFKFAHGSSESLFLPSVNELEELYGQIFYDDSAMVNFNYLNDMTKDGYFEINDMAIGEPVKNKMNYFKFSSFTCHALRLTCKIDPKGDVYPCCFLFDDNSAKSNFRHKYILGSMRSEKKPNKVVPPEKENQFEKIWYNNSTLNNFRQTILPIDPVACNYCTRHTYQNEYLNKLYKLFLECKHYGIAEEIIDGHGETQFWV